MPGGVYYYRAELPARHLPGVLAPLDPIIKNREWEEWRDEEGELHVRLTRQKSDCAIWMFSGNTTRALLMREQQNNGIRVLMEVDDNYQVPPPNESVSEWRMHYDKTDEPTFEIHKRIVPWVDGMIVATPQLEREYAHLCDNIYVCPNQIDPDDWEDIGKQSLMDRPLRIGWAASDSHWKDIDIVGPAFRWASEQKDVEIVILGIQAERFLHHKFHFKHVEWADNLADYRKNLGILDVMVCPLRQGVWEDCKSDVKALEGAMAGAAVVVSKTEPYRPWWGQDEPPCLVADGTAGFMKAIRTLVHNRSLVRELAQAGKEYVLSERTIEKNIWRWREACATSGS